mgnify:CR=1 FL=1
MPNEYYKNRLYPLQDDVLRLVAALNSPFYLTGGTALSRCYLHHRYSDDLDFFTNGFEGYQRETERILDALKKHFRLDVVLSDTDFLRVQLQRDDVFLKLDFINDVPFRIGGFESFEGCRIDNPFNILSNKLSALSRQAPKDYCDIAFLAKSFSFDWIDMLAAAKQKDVWVNELTISELIDQFDVDALKDIPWINQVDLSGLQNDFKVIAIDILKGENSFTNG